MFLNLVHLDWTKAIFMLKVVKQHGHILVRGTNFWSSTLFNKCLVCPHYKKCGIKSTSEDTRRRVDEAAKVNWGDLRSLGTKGNFFPLTLTGSVFCLHFPGGARLQKLKWKLFLKFLFALLYVDKQLHQFEVKTFNGFFANLPNETKSLFLCIVGIKKLDLFQINSSTKIFVTPSENLVADSST